MEKKLDQYIKYLKTNLFINTHLRRSVFTLRVIMLLLLKLYFVGLCTGKISRIG